MSRLRLIFMGTPDFALPTLQALLDAGHDVACAYTQPPRPAGRGKRLTPSPVQALAEANGIAVRHPKSLRGEEEQQGFAALRADAAVVVAYGLILPQPILDAPRLGCINVHASLLPRWRGAAPIQRAIMAGDNETGVTIMRMEAGLDTGPMLLREAVPIGPESTAGALHDRLAKIGAPLLLRALDGLAEGTLAAEPQDESLATYAAKIDKAEAHLDWRRPAGDVARLVHGLSPFPGAWFALDDTRIKILAARVVDGAGAPGTVLDDRLTIACGSGALLPTLLQRAGKAPMDAAALLRGLAAPAGTIVG